MTISPSDHLKQLRAEHPEVDKAAANFEASIMLGEDAATRSSAKLALTTALRHAPLVSGAHLAFRVVDNLVRVEAERLSAAHRTAPSSDAFVRTRFETVRGAHPEVDQALNYLRDAYRDAASIEEMRDATKWLKQTLVHAGEGEKLADVMAATESRHFAHDYTAGRAA